MILAELEVCHSRPVAPTRRVALGEIVLPTDPPPGFGGVLLAGVVAQNIGGIEPDQVPDLARLTTQLENGHRISQPRLRYRFQVDRIGLQRSRHRLISDDGGLRFEFDDDHGEPAQQLLGAVYAAGQMRPRSRRSVMSVIRSAIGWEGALDADFIAAMSGFGRGSTLSAHALSHPVEWALGVLEFSDAGRTRVNGGRKALTTSGGSGPNRREIQGRFRDLLRAAHPDHGGDTDGAARRIADLTEARRILLET